ncbi:MAG: response regulator [Candidatus Binatia bacterium]
MTEPSKDDPQRPGDEQGLEKPGKPGRTLRPAVDFGAVLVVDDDPDAVEILTRLLGMQKFSTVPARSGLQCLEIVRSQPIDVILLDVNMPGMDGLTVCAELARDERTRSIPIILVTARDDYETRVAGMKLGVSEFLAKPVNKTELFARVRGQLEMRALARQMDRAMDEEPKG